MPGAARRLARMAGEMVSRGAVERVAGSLWPEHRHAAVALPDQRKGEQVVLLTDNQDAAVAAILAQARAQGIAEVMVPRVVLTVPAVPALATGKPDYTAGRALAEEKLGARQGASGWPPTPTLSRKGRGGSPRFPLSPCGRGGDPARSDGSHCVFA